MAFSPHLCRWGISQRNTAFLLLFAMVGMLFPLSYHSNDSRQKKDQSTPFPCQNRPCGCKTAEQCWKKCCCFTNAQKLAWAQKHRVRAPEFVVAAAKTEAQTKRACKACCQHRLASNTASNSDTKKPSKTSLFGALHQMRCEGVEITVSGTLICLPPALSNQLMIQVVVLEECVDIPTGRLRPVWREPPTPPPKIIWS